MKKTKSLFAIAGLSLTLMLVGSFANAQCAPQIGNNSACSAKFLSISSDNCNASSVFNNHFTITITVSQSGGSYTAYPTTAVIASSSTSGAKLTYLLRSTSTSGISFGVHMNGSCSSNYAAISIQ